MPPQTEFTMNQYQELAGRTAKYPKDCEVTYLALGLAGEAGELANKVKKTLRGDYAIEEVKHDLAQELGDILWYAAMLSQALGYEFASIGRMNIHKLNNRVTNGTIQGDGDHR